MIIRIIAPHFVAGYNFDTRAIAPIIRYMKRWTLARIKQYCEYKKWHLEIYD